MKTHNVILLTLFAGLIAATHFFILHKPFVEVHHYRIWIPAILIVVLLPLRDIIQAAGGRRDALIVLLLSCITVYLIRADYAVTGAAIGALIWAELVDFALWTYFRKFGWLTGMFVSDFVAAPIFTLMYLALIQRPLTVDADLLLQKYVALAVLYAIFVFIHTPTSFKGLPRWRNSFEVRG